MNANDRKIFGTLFFSIFAAVTGVGIVVPLLPVYAHDLGASGLYIGLIFGAFSLSRTFFPALLRPPVRQEGAQAVYRHGAVFLCRHFGGLHSVHRRGVPDCHPFCPGDHIGHDHAGGAGLCGGHHAPGQGGLGHGAVQHVPVHRPECRPLDRRCDQGPLQPRRGLHLHGDPCPWSGLC
jgi:hypothetical protein